VTELPLDAPAELPLPPLPRPPFWMVAIALVSIVVTWLPLALIARARVTRSAEPRVQLLQDMGVQPKFLQQDTNPLFADDRSMRPPIPGAVKFNLDGEDPEANPMYEHGFTLVTDPASGKLVVKYVTKISEVTPLNDALVQRGQARFNIYCFPCHGYDASGTGPVNQRALQLANDPNNGITWTQVANLTTDTIRKEADGQIFNTITNGIRSMPAYGPQIPVADRWAIVSYVRCLQFSQQAPIDVAPPDKQQALKSQ